MRPPWFIPTFVLTLTLLSPLAAGSAPDESPTAQLHELANKLATQLTPRPPLDRAVRSAARSPREMLPLQASPPPAAASPAAALPPTAAASSLGGSWVLNTVTALGAVVGLIFLVRAGVRKYAMDGGFATAASPVEVLSRVPLPGRAQVLVMRVSNRILLVGQTPSTGLRTLAEISDPQDVTRVLSQVAAGKPSSITRSFGSIVQRLDAFHDDSAHGRDEDEVKLDRARDRLSNLLTKVRTLTAAREAA